MRRVVICGATGRDFHDFDTVFRDDGETQVVVLACSDVSREEVMHVASRALVAGCSFALPGPRATLLAAAMR